MLHDVYVRSVFDPYDWMPGYGDSGIDIHMDDNKLIVSMKYDKKIIDSNENSCSNNYSLTCRSFKFNRALYFMTSAFPGVAKISPGKVKNAKDHIFSDLVEFVNSEWARECMEFYKNSNSGYSPMLRHFSVAFLASNMHIDVLAEDVLLSDEKTV